MVKTETAKETGRRVTEEMRRLGRQVWLAGLGAMSLAEEETRGAFERLVDRGEKIEGTKDSSVGRTVRSAAERAKDLGDKVGDAVQGTVSSLLQRAGVPSRDEIRTLIDKVDELTKKVEKLRAS